MMLTWSLNPVCLFREIMCCWLFLLIPAAKFFRFIWVSFCETWKIAILCHILFKKISHLIHLILHLIWAYWIFGTSYADILVFLLILEATVCFALTQIPGEKHSLERDHGFVWVNLYSISHSFVLLFRPHGTCGRSLRLAFKLRNGTRQKLLFQIQTLTFQRGQSWKKRTFMGALNCKNSLVVMSFLAALAALYLHCYPWWLSLWLTATFELETNGPWPMWPWPWPQTPSPPSLPWTVPPTWDPNYDND